VAIRKEGLRRYSVKYRVCGIPLKFTLRQPVQSCAPPRSQMSGVNPLNYVFAAKSWFAEVRKEVMRRKVPQLRRNSV